MTAMTIQGIGGVVPADARARLLDGLLQSIEQRGYRDTTITDVVRIARASRRTFYRVFETKDDALLALVEQVDEAVIRDMSAVDRHAGWREQVAQSLEIYFDHIRRRPAVFLCSIRELPYLGEVAAPLIRRSDDAFANLIHDFSDHEEFRLAGLAPAPRRLAMMIIGALNALVVEILESNDDIMDGLDLAIAGTTALLATNFEERRT